MNLITNFFKKALNIGIQPDMTRIKQRHVRLVNGVSLISIIFVLPFTIFYTLSGDSGYLINGLVSVLILLVFSSNIFLNYRGNHDLARFLLLQCTGIAIFIGSIVTSKELLLSLFLVTTMTQTWIFCSIREEKFTLLFHNITFLIYFILVEQFYHLFDFLEPFRPALNVESVVEMNFIIMFGFLMLINGLLGFLTWEYEVNDEELKIALETSQILLKEKEEANINKDAANKELKKSLNQLEQLAYASSHDLKMPLRGIVSFSQLLQRKYSAELGEEGNEYLDYIVKEGKRQFEQIEGLLNYLKTDQREKNIQIIDANLALESVIGTLKPTIYDKNILIHQEKLPSIKCDYNDIEQVIYNITSNACKFIASDREATIHIACQEKDEYHQFSIKDNGVGFDMEYHEQMFGIFKTLSVEDRQKGSGIGLSICKKIVEYYGGKIWAESVINKGTTFYFTFPRE